MAEAKKFKKPKKALGELKKLGEVHFANPTVEWYINNGWAACSVQYNSWADLFHKDWDINWCLLDNKGTIKQYSTNYDVLKKFNPAWVGFYPSQYEVEEVVDEAGNTEKVKITDLEQLKKFPTLNKGAKFYFAGRKYKVTLVDDTRGTENYIGFAEDKTSLEMIVVRGCKSGWSIWNLAMNGNKIRQVYGSGAAVCDALRYYGKDCLFNEEKVFMPQNEAYEGEW